MNTAAHSVPAAGIKKVPVRTPGGPRWTKGDRIQPLELIYVDDALLTTATVLVLTGDSKSTLRRKVLAGSFPMPITPGDRDNRWVAWQVRAYLRGQAEAHGIAQPERAAA